MGRRLRAAAEFYNITDLKELIEEIRQLGDEGRHWALLFQERVQPIRHGRSAGDLESNADRRVAPFATASRSPPAGLLEPRGGSVSVYWLQTLRARPV